MITEEYNIVKVEGRCGEIYDFFESPPEPIHRCTGYVYMIGRKGTEPTDYDLLYIGTTNDLPKQLKLKRLKNFFEANHATHVLTFRVDDKEEMEIIKDEITEKFPTIKDVLK
jgi:hypothetical protein